ncbi:MAG: prephenate dehydrogenase/arogenate dehydrogenase family protein [Thermoanaerobaculia bacterium]|nr:prephenate dehydrogenase/arogenate dehydrogenase family protein [Thermoanaerobaculia bacterium]
MSLDALRARLGAVDQEILRLIAERQAMATEIGRIKRDAGRATRDYAQEREVVQRARSHAEGLGLSGDLGEELMLLLIRSSLTVQEQDLVSSQGGGDGRRVLVIGGAGRMGRWFARFLASQGFAVEIADPAAASGEIEGLTDWRDADLEHDLIVVATPMPVARTILAELAERRPAGIVFDVGSLKSPLRDELHHLVAAGVRATSLHPMFGPDTELLSGRHVIFIDIGCPEATQFARDLFASTMAKQVSMDLESHDHLIAYVLGLSHAVNLAFFTALAESGEAAPKLAELSSTTFDAQLEVARRVAEDNPQLYFEIQTLNDYGSESLAALLYAVERIRSLVRARDEEGFKALMEKGRSYLAARSETR